MTIHPACEREDEAIQAVQSGRWPERIGSDLQDHVARCAPCAEVVLIAQAIVDDHAQVVAAAVVPPASVVWWRAQRRAREEAIRTVRRAAATLQWIAVLGGVTTGVAVAGLVAFSPLTRWLKLFTSEIDLFRTSPEAFGTIPILVVSVLWVAMIPAGLLVAFSDRWPKRRREAKRTA